MRLVTRRIGLCAVSRGRTPQRRNAFEKAARFGNASRARRSTDAIGLATLWARTVVLPVAFLSCLCHVVHALGAPTVAPAASWAGGVSGAVALLTRAAGAVTAVSWNAAERGGAPSARGRRRVPASRALGCRPSRDRQRDA